MGQKYSYTVKLLQEHALVLKDLAVVTHQGVIDAVKDLNNTLQGFASDANKQIVFTLKEGTCDAYPYLWKAIIKILCFKIDKVTGRIQTRRVLDLRQFCKLYRDVLRQVRCTRQGEEEEWQAVDANGEVYHTVSLEEARETLSASMIFTRVEAVAAEDGTSDECCICMDQKAEVILSCVHSFCRGCIERWSIEHTTCPICRNEMSGNDEFWVVPDIPTKNEVGQFVLGLAEGAGEPSS